MHNTENPHHEKARKVLKKYFSNVGFPAIPNEIGRRNRLQECEEKSQEDLFFSLVNVRDASIDWTTRNIETVIGYTELSFRDWFNLIHPGFIEIYLQFANAAYGLSVKYKKEMNIGATKVTYSIRLPILIRMPTDKGGFKKEYWMVKQTSIPFQFDKEGNMCSHINKYVLLDPYDDNDRFKKPFVKFEGKTQILNNDLLQNTRELITRLFFRDLNKAQQDTLIWFWILYTDFKENERLFLPTTKNVAEELDVGITVVYKYNAYITNIVKDIFSVESSESSNEFPDILSVVEFLYNLFGGYHRSDLDH